jgi:hypothetical protein
MVVINTFGWNFLNRLGHCLALNAPRGGDGSWCQLILQRQHGQDPSHYDDSQA